MVQTLAVLTSQPAAHNRQNRAKGRQRKRELLPEAMTLCWSTPHWSVYVCSWLRKRENFSSERSSSSRNTARRSALSNRRITCCRAREQLNKSSKQKTVGNIGTAVHGCSDTELLAEVQTAQRRESQLQEESRMLKQEKQALQVDLQMMKKERDLAKAQVLSTSGDKGFELKLLEERHKEEVSALKKRLQWYAENQELLDKARLRSANAEIQRLTEQVERLKMEVAKQANQQQKKVKEMAGTHTFGRGVPCLL
ncbi:hypothetical protein PHYPO_G00001700 [Pangasianodon hypophthalmus]|uniref:Centrosomal protein of 162 kDa n=1 Tax=Pangasianodon hypophthalmus TaxID=310915 RepID=A0A5N5Q3T8_PANHP|nr:hypothetical protein PHYPO_G00001700 [Pangasianodon hypophthalmus]